MEWAIATCSLGGLLEEKLVAIAEAGFQAVEVFEEDLAEFQGRPQELRALVESLGLRIIALQPLRDYEAMPEPLRIRSRERALRWLDLVADLGADLTYVCSNTSPLAVDDTYQAAEDLYILAEMAAQRGLKVGYEALAWGRHMRDWHKAWQLVQRVNHPHLGLILDSFHFFARGASVESLKELSGEKIFLVQLSDAPNLLMDPLALSHHYRAMPGQGDWPIEDFMKLVLSKGYRGAVSLEIFNDWFRSAPPEQVAQDAMRSLKYLFDRLGLLFPPLPPEISVQGVGFLEVGVEEDDLEIMKNLLSSVGLRAMARHPALNYELWGSGSVRLLIRSDLEDYPARELPAILGVGLEVDKAAPLAARARELGLTLLSKESREEFCLDLPTIKGVGNSRLYLLDKPLERILPFLFDEQPGEELLRVDHFTNVVTRFEVYSWLLIYRSWLGLEVDPLIEVFDPYGMFYSRSLRNMCGTLCIPINTAEGDGTFVSRFLGTLGHAGIQHSAFLVSDIFAFAEKAIKQGFAPLRIPASYYRILSARYALDTESLERLEAFNLLYERDPSGGEFFHLYTPTFRNRFFFEVAERRGGYKGFGASNAAIRIRAQLRVM